MPGRLSQWPYLRREGGRGAWPRQWASCWWRSGSQLSKSGRPEGRVSCTETFTYLDLGFKCQIILFLTMFVQLFKLVWMFYVHMAPYWRSQCPVLAWGLIFLAEGGEVRSLLSAETGFDSTAGMFLRIRSYIQITPGSGKPQILLVFSFLNYCFHGNIDRPKKCIIRKFNLLIFTLIWLRKDWQKHLVETASYIQGKKNNALRQLKTT